MTASAWLSSFGLLTVMAADIAAQPFRETEARFNDIEGKAVAVRVLSAAPEQTRLTVLHAATVIGRQDQPTSLEAMAATRDLARPRSKTRYVASAGFSSYRSDLPVGLLVSGGKVLGAIDASPPRATLGRSCPAAARAKLRFSGVLCVPSNGPWRILPAADYQPRLCTEAVQAGPLLVEPGGALGICEEEAAPANKFYPRLVVCIDRANTLHLVLSQPTALFPLARWLVEGPLKCDTALNLSGDEQAGWIRLPSTQKLHPKSEGRVQAALASALLLEAR